MRPIFISPLTFYLSQRSAGTLLKTVNLHDSHHLGLFHCIGQMAETESSPQRRQDEYLPDISSSSDVYQ